MLRAFPVVGKKKASDICSAFIMGAPRNAEGAVFYGVNETNVADWKRESASGLAIFIDNAWFDSTRGTHYRVAKNQAQIDGTGKSDGKRFAALNLDIKPWRVTGSHVVVCPQSVSFLRTMCGVEDWAETVTSTLRRVTTRELRVREWSHDKIGLARTLASDLVGAWALATHSSAAAVTALLEGIPVLSQAGATRMMSRDIEDVEHPMLPPDRERFFGVLADNQFTLEEMRKGRTWAALNG